MRREDVPGFLEVLLPTRLTGTSKSVVSALTAVMGAVLSSSTGLGTQTGRRLASFTCDQLGGSPDSFCSNWVKGLKCLRCSPELADL